MRILVFFFCVFVSQPLYAQESGFLASTLYSSCKESLSKRASESETFCSGYFEATIEHLLFKEEKAIYSCYPTYGDYDPFKRKVIQVFMKSYEREEAKGNQFVRAFNLVRNSINEVLEFECQKE